MIELWNYDGVQLELFDVDKKKKKKKKNFVVCS